MKSQQRLIGIDLFRVIAIFGVIVLHADSGARSISWGWQLIRCFFGFAVPFFLATSFYLAVSKSKQGKLKLNSRLTRLLIPYLIWSTIYVFYKLIKYTIDGDSIQLSFLFQDPVGLVLFGSSAIHLYFLPLLFWGIVIVKVLEIIQKNKLSLKILIIGFIISFLSHSLIISSGNGFKIVLGTAFDNWFYENQFNIIIRVLLVLVAWTLWCLPYIFSAQIMHHLQINSNIEICNLNFSKLIILVWGFIGFTLIDFNFYSNPIFEVFRGYLILLIAINLSKYIEPNQVLIKTSKYSFGIYFVHLIFIEAIYIIGIKVNHIMFTSSPILLYLIIAFIVFSLSWMTVYLLSYNKYIFSLLMGIK